MCVTLSTLCLSGNLFFEKQQSGFDVRWHFYPNILR